ncbi:helix-turn-helix transcriptional regulator [Pseudorhodoplanes sp.]|uniref:helix-turn-helix transcriptional regulator n=1 Tax=Pseudorhodoplanes sp. TaxID=1934341 RepID=UPI00391B8D2E
MAQFAAKPDRSRRLLAAIDQLYDTVTDLDKWPAFLATASALFAARGSQVGHTDLVNGRLSFNVVHGYDWSAAHMQHYESLIGEDPRIPYFSANPFKPVHCRMSLSDEQLRASRVYREVLSVGGVEYTLGVNLVEDTRSLTYFLVLRDRDQPCFSDQDCGLMAALIPHLNRALKLQRELGLLAFERSAAFDALDAMALGIVVLDAEARVKFSNEAARQIAESGDGIRFSGPRLVIDGADGDTIRMRLRRLLRPDNGRPPAARDAFKIARRSGRDGYTILLSALGGNRARFGWNLLDEPLAIVYIRDPDSPEETRAELLQRLYGLMPSQARLAELLAMGCSLKEAAERLGITLVSARQYLKLIFQKTGTHRQSELVRKVLLVPPAPKWHDTRGGATIG